jgi:hypothetical protein
MLLNHSNRPHPFVHASYSNVFPDTDTTALRISGSCLRHSNVTIVLFPAAGFTTFGNPRQQSPTGRTYCRPEAHLQYIRPSGFQRADLVWASYHLGRSAIESRKFHQSKITIPVCSVRAALISFGRARRRTPSSLIRNFSSFLHASTLILESAQLFVTACHHFPILPQPAVWQWPPHHVLLLYHSRKHSASHISHHATNVSRSFFVYWTPSNLQISYQDDGAILVISAAPRC